MKKIIILSLFLVGCMNICAADKVFSLVDSQRLFDGYSDEVVISNGTILDGDFCIEGWIAVREYSFNVSAIVNRMCGFNDGFLMGIDNSGKLVGAVAGSSWRELRSKSSIPLLEWTHVAMVCRASKQLELYINGKLEGSIPLEGSLSTYPQGQIVVGKTLEKMTPSGTEREKSAANKHWMRFNGGIAQLRLHENVMSRKAIETIVRNKPSDLAKLEFPRLPGEEIGMGAFGAFYTNLKYTPGWDKMWRTDEYPDVVVRFPDMPVKYIFWRGTGYIPAVVTENNIWMSDQSLENFLTGECYEAMGDKQCRYSHVRIIENTPARCVVHWRYAIANVNHQIYAEDEEGWGNWVDEYWTIFPDGIAARKQMLHSPEYVKSPSGFQFQETIFFNQAGSRPEDNINYEAISFCDMEGNTATYSWEKGAPKNFGSTKYQPIQLINLKSHYRPFSIFTPQRVTTPFKFGWTEGYSTFPCWNHWPVSQIKSDGRNATVSDRPSHSSLAETTGGLQVVDVIDNSIVCARQMIGMTTENLSFLLPLAKSWNIAPEMVSLTENVASNGYDVYSRTYNAEVNGNADKAVLRIQASDSSPIQNIALEIKNWNSSVANISIDGMARVDYRVGVVSTLTGDNLIVWINLKTNRPQTITIAK